MQICARDMVLYLDSEVKDIKLQIIYFTAILLDILEIGRGMLPTK